MTFARHCLAALRLLVVMTVLLGVGYPLAVTLIGHAIWPRQADGSLVTDGSGAVVGSSLVGQSFGDEVGWFWSRPSACDYSGTTSGGTNLPPDSAAQQAARAERQTQLEAANPDAVGPVPEDALTASASCLDPDISPAYARWQVPRVASARGLPEDELDAMIDAATDPAPLGGLLGRPGVNVLALNLALSQH